MSVVEIRQTSSDGPRTREDGTKRRQILDGARAVFLADGFDAASMNEIARRAGVSKGTLYVYFESKEALFEELVRREKREQAEQTCVFDHDDADVEAVLRGVGERLLDRMLRPDSIAHFRIVAAVAPKFPSIGRAFYEAGPQYGKQRLAEYLERQRDAGVIAMDDPERAAMFFLDLCKSCHLLPVLLCVEPVPSPEKIATHVEAATVAFLRAFPLVSAA